MSDEKPDSEDPSFPDCLGSFQLRCYRDKLLCFALGLVVSPGAIPLWSSAVSVTVIPSAEDGHCIIGSCNFA